MKASFSFLFFVALSAVSAVPDLVKQCGQLVRLDLIADTAETRDITNMIDTELWRASIQTPYTNPSSNAMPPYLETVKSFTEVPVTDAGVDTVEFLLAAEGLVGMFDLLGSAAFIIVQNDLKGNIAKVRARYQATPTLSATLESLVENEKGEKKRTATEGLLWLLRGLSFTCKALENTQSKGSELSAAFTQSYEGTLKKFHNFVVKGLFSVAMKACPLRADFFAKLAADPDGGNPASQEKLDEELSKWLAALSAIITRLEAFYEKGYPSKL